MKILDQYSTHQEINFRKANRGQKEKNELFAK